MIKMRSGLGVDSAARIASGSPLSAPVISTSLSPLSPVSIERRTFCRLSGNERPIAMASPTDFIEVVNSGFASSNFSKVKRGILVTM